MAAMLVAEQLHDDCSTLNSRTYFRISRTHLFFFQYFSSLFVNFMLWHRAGKQLGFRQLLSVRYFAPYRQQHR